MGAVLPVVAILVLLTVAAAFYIAPRLGPRRVVFDAAPDRPCAFGYRMAWLAIRDAEPAAVVQALALQSCQAANWNSGIGTVYDTALGGSRVFVSPPVDGWTFVVGLSLPPPASAGLVDKAMPLLLGLSQRFGEVQYYYSYPLLDLFAWARVTDGAVQRAFAINDEGVLWKIGRPTREERALGLKLFELRGVRARKGDAGGEIILHPTEDHVIRLARKWSVDPTGLGLASSGAGLGWIGHAPASWNNERLRKTA
jgi:hypothetical protein